MNHHWGCTSIYRPLSYPFRSLDVSKIKKRVLIERYVNKDNDIDKSEALKSDKLMLKLVECQNLIT